MKKFRPPTYEFVQVYMANARRDGIKITAGDVNAAWKVWFDSFNTKPVK